MNNYVELVLEEGDQRDLIELAALARDSFSDPWSSDTFRREISLPFTRLLIARDSSSQKLVGYVLFWLVSDEMQIHSLATHSNYRRKGIATKLIGSAICEARRHQIRTINLEVRISNKPARNFYEKMGLSVIGLRKRYYNDTEEDALIMAASINEIRIKQ